MQLLEYLGRVRDHRVGPPVDYVYAYGGGRIVHRLSPEYTNADPQTTQQIRTHSYLFPAWNVSQYESHVLDADDHTYSRRLTLQLPIDFAVPEEEQENLGIDLFSVTQESLNALSNFLDQWQQRNRHFLGQRTFQFVLRWAEQDLNVHTTYATLGQLNAQLVPMDPSSQFRTVLQVLLDRYENGYEYVFSSVVARVLDVDVPNFHGGVGQGDRAGRLGKSLERASKRWLVVNTRTNKNCLFVALAVARNWAHHPDLLYNPGERLKAGINLKHRVQPSSREFSDFETVREAARYWASQRVQAVTITVRNNLFESIFEWTETKPDLDGPSAAQRVRADKQKQLHLTVLYREHHYLTLVPRREFETLFPDLTVTLNGKASGQRLLENCDGDDGTVGPVRNRFGRAARAQRLSAYGLSDLATDLHADS